MLSKISCNMGLLFKSPRSDDLISKDKDTELNDLKEKTSAIQKDTFETHTPPQSASNIPVHRVTAKNHSSEQWHRYSCLYTHPFIMN